MIEKLVKEFEKIRASLTKSKKLIVADIDKIDEKYRKLAQEEKKSLTENLAILNEQLKYYDKMLDGETVVEESSDNSEEEPAIFDSIYPENNKEDEAESVAESNELAQVAAVVDAVSDNSVPTTAEVGTDVALESPAEETEKVKGLTMDEIVQKLEDAGIVDVETVAPQDNDWVTEPKEVPVLEMSDTGWAEFPEDWK